MKRWNRKMNPLIQEQNKDLALSELYLTQIKTDDLN